MTNDNNYKAVEVPKARVLPVKVPGASRPQTAGATSLALQPPKSNARAATNSRYTIKETEEIRKRLELLYEVSRKVGSFKQLSGWTEKITHMTQRTLNASASSVLLLDNEDRDLIFEVADGQVGKQLKRIKISAQSGIAGWVACHGKPLIINDVSKDQRFNKFVDTITGFVTKSIICVPLATPRKVIGVIEVLNKQDGSDFSEGDLKTLMSVASTAAMAIDTAKLHQSLLDSYKSTVKILVAAVDAKDPYALGHSQRVSEYVLLGASSLPLSREEKEVIEYAAILHDVGKAYIPDSILLKPGALTTEEWKLMRRHPVIGANMLKEIPFLEKASKIVLYHHERYDGSGYPSGLKGEAIPIGARLIAVADAFDTMTTHHLYRVASGVDRALEKLRGFGGIQFCPIAVQAFVSGFNKFHSPVKN